VISASAPPWLNTDYFWSLSWILRAGAPDLLSGKNRKEELMKRLPIIFFGFILMLTASVLLWSITQQPVRHIAREIKKENPKDRPYFFRPVALLVDQNEIYILEGGEERIQVYSADGLLSRSLGQKGKGPAEFSMPAGMDILSGEIYVADFGNKRIQILDKKGNYLGGFRVPFSPRNVVALDRDRIAVSRMPMGIDGSEKMLCCYNSKGELLWQALDSFFSNDRVYDALRNHIIFRKDDSGNLYVLWRWQNQNILKIDKNGQVVRKIPIRPGYPSKSITLPLKNKSKELQAVCWNGVWHNNRLYLITSEYTDDNDMGPGKEVYLIDESGEISGIIEFPRNLKQLAVSGKFACVLDTEDELYLYRVGPK